MSLVFGRLYSKLNAGGQEATFPPQFLYFRKTNTAIYSYSIDQQGLELRLENACVRRVFGVISKFGV